MRETKDEITVRDDAVSAVMRLHPAKDDVLLFKVATDDSGFPLCDLETVNQTAQMVQDILKQQGCDAACIFMFDKICLFSIDSCDEAIEKLKKVIKNLEAARQKLEYGEDSYVTVDCEFDKGNIN